jgi:hypothetical protein
MWDRTSHSVWRRKWRSLTEHENRQPSRAVYWHSGESRSAVSLYAELARSDELVCVIVPFGPDAVSDADNDPFAAALAAAREQACRTRMTRSALV